MGKLSLAVEFGLSVFLASNVHANNLINGGFETGDFTGWTTSGTASVCAGGDGVLAPCRLRGLSPLR